jgi:hypothetical protein
MKDKKSLLRKRVQETQRTPQPARLLEADKRRREVKAMAYSLYPAQINWVEELATTLRNAGNPMANRSLIVREAILRLQEELRGKTAQEIFRDFNSRQEKRAQADGQ